MMRYDRRHGKGGARKYSVVKKLRAKCLFNFKKSKTFNWRMKKSGGPFHRIYRGKSVLKPSNYNSDQMDAGQVSSTDQMDVIDQARTIQFQDEIIMDILSRLPMRSLLQSKCVSKLWYALISDPYFRMIHLKRAKNDRSYQKLLIITLSPIEGVFSYYRCPLSPVQADNDVQKLVHPSRRSKRIFRVQCCCDGLAVVMVSNSYEDVRPILLLWNPSTNESVELPSPEFLGERFKFGMGYDSTSSDYKIFIVNNGKGGCALTSGILSLKGGSWRKFDKHPDITCNEIYYTDALAFVHETFHWICSSRNQSLVSFSISSEVYGEVAMPEEILHFKDSMSIGVTELDEMLCVYYTFLDQGRMSYKSWVLKEYGVKECWSALFSVEDPGCFIVPKYRFADGEVLFWCSHIPSKGGWTFQTSRGAFGNWSRSGMRAAYTFTESLISPKSITC